MNRLSTRDDHVEYLWDMESIRSSAKPTNRCSRGEPACNVRNQDYLPDNRAVPQAEGHAEGNPIQQQLIPRTEPAFLSTLDDNNDVTMTS